MTISLCMICGNEAANIAQCLDSAKAAFDELCLVRAIGDSAPDNTNVIAAEWCEQNGKGFRIAEYQNTFPLPHVDDFGAARNLSFSLARSEWLMWLDCDDYLDDVNCDRIRHVVETHSSFDGFYCAYLSDPKTGFVLRERIIRRGKGRWIAAIHETCKIDGPSARCEQIQVFHRDHAAKDLSSAARNAAILERFTADSARYFFYLHADLKALGRTEEAIRAANAALVLLLPERVEDRYKVLLNLAEMDKARAGECLITASAIQPHRREAWAYLCQGALNRGETESAWAYFRILDALPLPEPIPFAHEAAWHGWGRNYLHLRCLRACGRGQEAADLEVQFSKDPDYVAGFASEKQEVAA